MDIFTTTAFADFSDALAPEISPGKVHELSARTVRLYMACLSVIYGFRVYEHTHRPRSASLSVCVPTVVLLLWTSFSC